MTIEELDLEPVAAEAAAILQKKHRDHRQSASESRCFTRADWYRGLACHE